MRRWCFAATASLLLACGGTGGDPLNDAGGDASGDASDDHKNGTSLDAGADAPLFGDSDAGAWVATCELLDAVSPPTSCSGAVNQNLEPVPNEYYCPRDSGTHPFGQVGVDCMNEGDYQNVTEWCCK